MSAECLLGMTGDAAELACQNQVAATQIRCLWGPTKLASAARATEAMTLSAAWQQTHTDQATRGPMVLLELLISPKSFCICLDAYSSPESHTRT